MVGRGGNKIDVKIVARMEGVQFERRQFKWVLDIETRI
jgi:hypothetical protein